MKLRIATCKTLPEVDVDEAPLAAALAAAGIDAALRRVGRPGRRLGRADPDDHPLDVELRARTSTRSSRGSIASPRPRRCGIPPDVVRDNVHKRYLLELAARGVPVVPTTLVERGRHDRRCPTAGIVIKPEVGAGSLGTQRVRARRSARPPRTSRRSTRTAPRSSSRT